MKGPQARQKFDVRRVWQCPACGRRRKTAGSVVSVRCTCTQSSGGQPVWMQLVDDPGSPEGHRRPSRPVAAQAATSNEPTQESP